MTGSPLPSRAREGLLFRLRALLVEGAAHRLDTAPPDSIVNAPVPAVRRGRSSAVREMLRPEGGGHGHGRRQRSLTGARSEERRVGKRVDHGGRRSIKKK